MRKKHREHHRIEHIGWLRAAVLGANDGIISTSSLVLGVAAAHAAHGNMVLTAAAGLVAGAMSMATGEYVSVSSQADTEKAAIAELPGIVRITFWSTLAMAFSAAVGAAFGASA
jgi:VIT1/CCC1 family predicted Fe2+/Mn2+ transporter